MSTRDTGYDGESRALSEYLSKGYIHIKSNWYCHKIGEIDIILLTPDRETVVFSEVKCRGTALFSSPATAVNSMKRKRMRLIAKIFIADNPEFQDKYVRFDVVEIIEKQGLINIIENAF